MLSLSKLVERAGLVPFASCVALYCVVWGAKAGRAACVATKCAPVLCLLLLVLARRTTQRQYSRRVAAGLALSALGDALLVEPARLGAGMAAFGAAHAAYVAAFGLRADHLRLALAIALATGLFLTQLRVPPELRAGVPLYGAALGAAGWRGAARGGRAGRGALLFLVSDAILAHGLFAEPLPYSQVLVMSTYYMAQLGIALSAFENELPKVQ